MPSTTGSDKLESNKNLISSRLFVLYGTVNVKFADIFSSEKKQEAFSFEAENDSNKQIDNMGSSHSSSAAAVAAGETQKQQQQLSEAYIGKEQPPHERKEFVVSSTPAATLTKARSHEEKSSSNTKKRNNSCTANKTSASNPNDNGSGNGKRQSACHPTGTTLTGKVSTSINEPVEPQMIIKSLSNMTNKSVGEAKIMTGVSKPDTGHNQQQQQCHAAGNLDSGSGKQHVQSSLQTLIKGVVKPAHKQHSTSSAMSATGNKRGHNQNTQPTTYGRHLDRPSRGPEDSLERRRKSLQDGDVFIYPRLYKDLNECRKCLRDNRICNCIKMELSSDGSSSADEKSTSTPHATPEATAAAAASTTATDTSTRLIIPINNAAANQCIDDDDRQSSGTKNIDQGGCGKAERPVYQINITTASSIEQRAPKLITALTALSSANQVSLNMAIDNPLADGDENNNNIMAENRMVDRAESASSKRRLGLSRPKKVSSSGRCGNDSETSPVKAANIAPPCNNTLNSELLISGRCDDDTRAAATTTAATASSSPSLLPLMAQRTDFAATSTNWPITRGRDSHCDLVSPCSSIAAAQSLEVGVERSPTSISLVSRRKSTTSSPPTKLEAKLTTISIGASPIQIPMYGEQFSSSTTHKNGKNSGNHERDQTQHTSIISIQTRRRNMATKLGGRRAIYEDNRDDHMYDLEPELNDCLSQELDGRDNCDSDGNEISTSLVPFNAHGNALDACSPSLSSFERQLSSSERVLISEPIAIRDSLSPIDGGGGSSSKDSSLGDGGGGGVLDYSPILSSVRDYIKNMNTELEVQTSLTSPDQSDNLVGCARGAGDPTDPSIVRETLSAADLLQVASTCPSMQPARSLVSCSSANSMLAELESPIQLVTSTAAGIVQATFTTTLPAASITAHVQTAPSCVNVIESPSVESSLTEPKKSIFDGASKDEILEYLEDARERVPEILMAADDVMVISENELIVVNQLEPNSPATPISIVETSEVISETSDTMTNCSPALSRSGSRSSHNHSLTHPDQLRQHLEQMYQTSQLAAAAAAATETADEPHHQTTDRNNVSNFEQPLQDPRAGVGGSYLLEGTRIDSPDFRLIEGTESDGGRPEDQATKKQQLSLTGTRNDNIATAIVSQCNPIVGLLNFAGPIYAGRRNSVSESVSSQPSASSRENAMQILALQKRYTMMGGNHQRNSLSSPSSSSSPPSSASPSSSTSSTSSSNQTSGNCSAATSFYASSSLSCSSPLLNLNGGTTFTPSAFTMAPARPPHPPLISSELPLNTLMHKFDGFDLRLQSQQDTSLFEVQSASEQVSPDMADAPSSRELLPTSPDVAIAAARPQHVDRDDSGIGSESVGSKSNRLRAMTISGEQAYGGNSSDHQQKIIIGHTVRSNSENAHLNTSTTSALIATAAKLSRIDESAAAYVKPVATDCQLLHQIDSSLQSKCATLVLTTTKAAAAASAITTNKSTSNARFSSPQPSSKQNNSINLGGSRGGHYSTLNRLNNYFMNRHPFSNSDSTVEFQCLDCDQFIDVDQATIMNKTNELRLLRATDSKGRLGCSQSAGREREMTPEQLDRAYVAAMNGLPLCKSCEKKRIERKEIISEFVETELKYGRDLKIIHDEFYRPMQIAGLLSKDQINGVFLNLEELIMAHCKFADRLETAIREAHSIGDTDFNTVNIGNLFLESAEMLNVFESYCIRQGAAACLLARLAKERELLRIFLRVSQMENTLLRRMNLAAFLMVPVQRVTKYPLLLNRLYKVTAYHHKDREALRDAQLKVELHLEHINQQTKGIGASNKIWRRISSLSAPISSNRRGLMNAEDIGYIKLRKTAMDMLKWDRDETQFIHSGKLHFAPLTEFLTRQKMKPLRYLPAHALLIVLGRPNWKYRPDLVKANLDSKLMIPTSGGNGIKEAALLLFREKNGRFVPCREPLFLSNCILSADCSQFNHECPQNQPNVLRQNNQQQIAAASASVTTTTTTTSMTNNSSLQQHNGSTGSRKSASSCSSINSGELPPVTIDGSSSRNKSQLKSHGEISPAGGGSQTGSIDSTTTNRSMSPREHPTASNDSRTSSLGGDVALISSLRGLIDAAAASDGGSPPVAVTATTTTAAHSSRSYSLASALPRTTLTTTNSTINLSRPILSTASSNLTILNQLMTKVNNYHNRQSTNGSQAKLLASTSDNQSSSSSSSAKKRQVSPSASVDIINAGANSAIAMAASSALATEQSSLQLQHQSGYGNRCAGVSAQRLVAGSNSSPSGSSGNGSSSARTSSAGSDGSAGQPNYTSYHYFHYNHHQPYGDYEESFEIHERIGKESMLLRADTPLKTRYWLQMLRYHAKDLGQWRSRRNGLPNIMMMRHE